MHNGQPQLKTHRELFSDFFASLFGYPLADVRPGGGGGVVVVVAAVTQTAAGGPRAPSPQHSPAPPPHAPSDPAPQHPSRRPTPPRQLIADSAGPPAAQKLYRQMMRDIEGGGGEAGPLDQVGRVEGGTV
jgi:hypothetical protein